MNILFISPSINPFDKNGFGSVQRSNLLLEACARCGSVDVITFLDDVESNNGNCTVIYSQTLKTKVSSSRIKSALSLFNPWNVYGAFPKNQEAERIVKRFVQKRNYDFIVVRYIPEAMKCGLMTCANRLVIDVDDDPLEVTRNMAKTAKRFRKRLFHRLQACEMQITLNKILQNIRCAFYANPSQISHPKSVYLPNIPYHNIDNACVAEFQSTQPRLLFVGNLNFGHNATGVSRFIEDVFPLVKRVIPDAEFHIAGSCNNEVLKARWSRVDGVRILGYVADIQKEYAKCRAVVAPIYFGAGTNIKVLEAMQMMRPLVTTECGMRGFQLDFKDGQDCIVADSDVLFAEEVVRVLQDENLNHTLALHAHQVIGEKYNRTVFNRTVANALQ